MISPADVVAIAEAMRAQGVRRLRTDEIEMELGPMPVARKPFDLDDRAETEEAAALKKKALVYGSSR